MINLLFVDDEPVLLELAKDLLGRTADISVNTCLSAREALACLASRPYDAVVADYLMPEMNGITFLEKVREQYGDVPFIILTGRGREEVVIRALNNGADFYLQKGGDPRIVFTELLHVVRHCVLIRQAQKDLLEREERYHDLQNANDLIQSVAPDGRFLYVNRKWLETLGYDENDISNLCIFDIIHSESLDHCMSTFQRVIAGENVGIIDAVFRTRDGKKVYVEGIASCRMKDGKPQYTRGLFKDVTDRKQAEDALRESEERFRALVETTRDIIWEVDRDERYTYISPQVRDILGYSPEEVLGKRYPDFMPPDEAEKISVLFDTIAAAGKPIERLENINLHKDGHVVILETSGEPVRSADGTITGYRGIDRDITIRRRAQDLVRQSEQYLKTLIESIPAGVIVVDAGTHTILRANHTALALFGATSDEVIGKICHRFICPAANGNCPISDNGMHIDRSERILLDANGGEVHVLKSVTRANLSGQDVLIETFVDISDRKRAETALKESEHRLHHALEGAGEGLWDWHVPSGKAYFSPRFYTMLGYEPGEFPATFESSTALLFPDDRDAVVADLLHQIHERRQVFESEYRMQTKSGDMCWIYARGKAIEWDEHGNVTRLIGTNADITQRKRAESALQESEEKFRSLVEHALDGTLILNPQGTILFANSAAALQVEADDPAGLTGRNVMEFIAPDSRDEVVRDFAEVAGGHDAYLAQYHAVSEKGKSIYLESIGKVIGFGGKPAILISIRDITKRRQAEDALKNLSAYNRSLIEASLDPLVTISHDGKISDVNTATETVTGYTRAELVGTDFSDYFTEPERAREGCRTVFHDGTVHDYPLEIRHRDGHLTPVLYNATVFRDETGRVSGVFAAARDVTGLKRAEEALRQANRKLTVLSSITRHDIRNNLLVLQAYNNLVEKHVTDPDAREYLRKQEAAARAIGQHIEFSKDYEKLGIKDPAWQRVDEILSAATGYLDLNGVMVRIETTGLEVYADPMLKKVFYNLIDNALRYGETITEIRIHAEKTDTGLVIVFEDDGTGIPARDKEMIFTKGFGRNTGLGLFLSREILSITGISISETGSSPGGARFEILVPEGGYRFVG